VRLLLKADDMTVRQSILVQSKKMLMQCPLSFSYFLRVFADILILETEAQS
jgi:hypothetical protein